MTRLGVVWFRLRVDCAVLDCYDEMVDWMFDVEFAVSWDFQFYCVLATRVDSCPGGAVVEETNFEAEIVVKSKRFIEKKLTDTLRCFIIWTHLDRNHCLIHWIPQGLMPNRWGCGEVGRHWNHALLH